MSLNAWDWSIWDTQRKAEGCPSTLGPYGDLLSSMVKEKAPNMLPSADVAQPMGEYIYVIGPHEATCRSWVHESDEAMRWYAASEIWTPVQSARTRYGFSIAPMTLGKYVHWSRHFPTPLTMWSRFKPKESASQVFYKKKKVMENCLPGHVLY